MSTQGRISYNRLAWFVRYISGVGVCVAYSCEGQPRPRHRISRCSACAFFMDLSGNKDLLDRPLVAFFASRTSPPEALDLARHWAYEIAKTDKVVISGFHSPIERTVLNILLSDGCSVIVTLGRSQYRKIPVYLQTAYNEERVLFISFRNYSRHSSFNSQLRNWLTANLANEIVFAPFDGGSQLSTLHFTFNGGLTPCRILAR